MFMCLFPPEVRGGVACAARTMRQICGNALGVQPWPFGSLGIGKPRPGSSPHLHGGDASPPPRPRANRPALPPGPNIPLDVRCVASFLRSKKRHINIKNLIFENSSWKSEFLIFLIFWGRPGPRDGHKWIPRVRGLQMHGISSKSGLWEAISWPFSVFQALFSKTKTFMFMCLFCS